jgi:5-formyltetrahydrofolate cyclo-ligase
VNLQGFLETSNFLAADRNGHGLGFGKGFYDRFLAEVKPKCVTVGYSLLESSRAELPIDDWDIALTHVLTPTESLHIR